MPRTNRIGHGLSLDRPNNWLWEADILLKRTATTMNIPVIRGIIERRILVNYRVDPDALKRVLPEPFHPKLIADVGMAGICLIRLKHIVPASSQPLWGFLPKTPPTASRFSGDPVGGHGKVFMSCGATRLRG